MKIVVVGTGLIGSILVSRLTEHRQEAVAASRASGVDTLTGDGLAQVLAQRDAPAMISRTTGSTACTASTASICALTNLPTAAWRSATHGPS